ncbi:hypothetical protein [Streptomyces sp. 184]|uniref:hypothetical protein n=1 Tax=Streptomyces sp. 184 TaxID=1827526 RepID=UPI003892C9CA
MPVVQLTTDRAVDAGVLGRLASAVGAGLGLTPDAVVVQSIVAARSASGGGPAPAAVAVVRGRPRDPAAMRDAVERAAAALAGALALDPDLVFVTWPQPGTAANGSGALPAPHPQGDHP